MPAGGILGASAPVVSVPWVAGATGWARLPPLPRPSPGSLPRVSTKPPKLISERPLLKEPHPDPDALELIKQVEASEDLDGMTLEVLAEYLKSLLPGIVHGFDEAMPC